jgi:choline dehydrogenase
MGQEGNVTDLVARDLNNPLPNGNQTGLFGFPVHMAPGGIRRTAQHAIYEVQASSKAKFLNLQTQSFVTKVLFETPKGKGKKPIAVGVSYLKGQSIFKADPRWSANSTKPEARTAYARNGVVLAAGVFNTPQILKHSGIGPATELKKHKIPVVVDLPGVGENLQDNYEISVNAASTANFTDLGAAPCTFTGGEEDPCYHLWKEGKGPYTNGIIDALMYKTSKAAYGERDLFMWGQTGAFRGFYPVPNLDLPADPQSRTFGFSMAKIHSRSKGSVLIKGTDPTDVPDINFRFFEGKYGDADLAAMAEGIEFGRKIFKNTPAPVGPFTELDPCNVNAGESPNCNVKEFIRAQAWSHHATSSAAIGSDEDKLAVLDSKFRVRGVDNLRVVDGSAFPRNPGGFPVLPTFMLGEKASEVIIKEHKKN